MAGLWEGVPASPCSGASDDVPARHAPPRRSSRATSSSFGKRSRFSSRPSAFVTSATYSPDSSVVEFVGASSSKDARDADLVAKLNTTAADERKKMLLNKLRLIDERRARLRRIAEGDDSAANSTDFGSVIEAATPEPPDVEVIEQVPVPAFPRKSIRMKNALPALALDVNLANKSGVYSSGLHRFTKSPTPTSDSIYGSPMPSPRASPHLTHADLPSRTRSSRRATRPRTPSVLLKGMPGDTVLSQLPVGVLKCKRYAFCKKVISLLLKNSSAGPFAAPVKELWAVEAIPRYFDVITRPMDLGTVKKNMEGIIYLNSAETNPLLMFKPVAFAEDVRQVFRNAMVYNRQGDMLYNCAKDLLEEFEEMWANLPAAPPRNQENRRKRMSSTPRASASTKRGRIGDLSYPPRASSARTVTTSSARRPLKSSGKKLAKPAAKSVKKQSPKVFKIDENMTRRQMKKRLDYLGRCRIALLARTPLPRGHTFYDMAALLHDVPLDFTEKTRMSEGIRKLPTNKLDTFLGIVTAAMGGHDGGSDEFELDINVLDTKTLRNVEAFLENTLPNYKTIRTSDVGTEFSRVEDFLSEENVLKERISLPNKQPVVSSPDVSNAQKTVKPVVERDSEELYASSDSESESDSSDSDSSGSDSDSE